MFPKSVDLFRSELNDTTQESTRNEVSIPFVVGVDGKAFAGVVELKKTDLIMKKKS